jgi:GTPase
MMKIESQYKAGYAAIVGVPNVGKSTLLNSLIGQKISIVTKKPQTTRQRIYGILTREDAQIIFLDTPGLLKPKYLLHKEMMRNAEIAISDADVILVMIEAENKSELSDEVKERLSRLKKNKPVILVINKIDAVAESTLKSMLEVYSRQNIFSDIISISALKAKNIEAVINAILKFLPEHEAFYPLDIISESPERFFVSEFIRENIFKNYHEEIPYSAAVEIREFKERQKGKTLINADIIVERDSQKGIIIGKKGEALKKIGMMSRVQIEEFLQQEVFLELHVKVREKWRDNESMLRQFGYKSKQ